MICTPYQKFFGRSNHEECDGRGNQHEWGRRKVHTGFWCVNLRERPRLRWKDIIKMDFQEMGCRAWIGSIWLRIGTGGGHL